MIQASEILGCVPSDQRIFVENEPIFSDQHVHLVHPLPVPWSSLVPVIANELHLEIVQYEDWLDKLLSTGDTKEMHLVPFFQNISKVWGFAENREAFGMPKLEQRLALAASKTLRDSHEIQIADSKNWSEYWRKMGIL
ncbi:hypothetical protein J3R30DRAFT_3684255 [Lentinula aciculospora]|uniref:Uncharacterized protein n=1 Tax=Lentinula aciculospora TaxID=153920 RepID=A0A9W9A6U3_9AGAR|nr:hypothetical protein J3R30DRAFT_3684255 [Lentinula aciculospora]